MRGSLAKLLRAENPGKVPVEGQEGKREPHQAPRNVSAYRRAKREYVRSRRHT